MILNTDSTKPLEPTITSVIGHGGQTYGFKSFQGYSTQLEFGVSIITNEDFDVREPFMPFCDAFKAILDLRGETSYPDTLCKETPVLPLLYSC
jgi:hypothetical protein